MAINFYVMDLETTGVKANYHECTEIAIIRCNDRVQLFRKIKCDFPERANFDALKITNKSLADLSKGDDKQDVINICNKFFSEDNSSPAARCIIAHNAAFDRRFSQALWQEIGHQFPAMLWLDTIALVKDLLKKNLIDTTKIVKTATGKPSTTLQACCDMLGIKKIASAHSALVDTRNTYLLFNHLNTLGIDYLPHIKTFEHKAPKDEYADINDLDLSDI